MRSLTSLKFLAAEEQDEAFRQLNDAIGELLIRGRITREGHRDLLTMTNMLNDLWLNKQANRDGTPRKEERWPI